LGGLAGRNNPYRSFAFPIAVANEQQAGVSAQAQQQDSIFGGGMVLIEEFDRVFVEEDGSGFLKRHAMLFGILARLRQIPCELQIHCSDSVTTDGFPVNRVRGIPGKYTTTNRRT